MSTYLICSSPIYGHLAPMVTIGRGLAARGHRVTVLTGRKYKELVEGGGLAFRALPATADYDDADLDAWLPGREKNRGLAALRYDLIGMFIRVIPDQHRAVRAALEETAYDAVLGEAAFLGVLPTILQEPAGSRIPVLGVSALPVTLTSVDTAPFGPAMAPGSSGLSRLRNRILNTVLHAGPLKPIQTALDAALADVGAPRARGNFFDQPTSFDETFQLSAPSIEYPRRELPASVRFVGPLRPELRGERALPSWWGEVESGARPVVHVTQGTIDNADPGRLIVPTIRALAEENVLVVAATGGRPTAEVARAYGGSLPANARVAEFLPYDRLLAHTDVVVSNGGFGGVQQSLKHGVPLVVAGATEDKPEVAARVAWSGAGVDLRTGTPRTEQVRAAVRRVLAGDGYRAAAARIAEELAAMSDPVDAIAARLDALVGARSAV